MRQGMILTFILFVILGCGYQSTPSNENKTPSSTASQPTVSQPVLKILPQKISVSFPDVLKDTISSNSDEIKEVKTKKETNLQQLKKDIYKVEDIVETAKFNLLLLEQVIFEILERCEGLEHCVFEDKELFFVLDEKIIASIDNILDTKERGFLDTNDTLIHLGQIDFFKHEDEKYELKFNMLNSSFVEHNSSVEEQIQIFKWSKSSNQVTITYLYKNEIDTLVTTVRYFINSEGNELMYISDKSDTNVSIENTTLVVKKADDNSSYSLTSNTTIQQLSVNETNSSHFSTNIEVDMNSTHLLLVDKNTTEDISSIQNRDDELNVIVVATKPIVVTGPGIDLDSLLPTDTLVPSSESEEDLILFVFEVVGDGLASGDYLLLNPDTDISKMSLEDVLETSIGSFSVMEGKPQGSLYTKEFLDLLDELIIIKITNSQESTEVSEFMLIENKPKLNIVKK